MKRLKCNVKLITKTKDYINGTKLKSKIFIAPEKPNNISYNDFRQLVKKIALKQCPNMQFHSFCY